MSYEHSRWKKQVYLKFLNSTIHQEKKWNSFFFFKESQWEGKEAQEFATQPICFSLRGQHKDSFRYASLRKYITHMFLLEIKDISRHVLVIWEMNQNGEFKKGDEIVQKD